MDIASNLIYMLVGLLVHTVCNEGVIITPLTSVSAMYRLLVNLLFDHRILNLSIQSNLKIRLNVSFE